jgi:hypothetical protein
MKHVVYIGPDEWLITHSDGTQISDCTHLFSNIDGSMIVGNRARIAQRYWPDRTISNPIKLHWHSLKPSHPCVPYTRQLSDSVLRDILQKAEIAGSVECVIPSLVANKLAARYPDVVFHDMFLAFSGVVALREKRSCKRLLLVHLHASTIDIGVMNFHPNQSGTLGVYLTHAFESEDELTALINLLPVVLAEVSDSSITDVYITGRQHSGLIATLEACGYVMHQMSLRNIATQAHTYIHPPASPAPSPSKISNLLQHRFHVSLEQLLEQIKHLRANRKDGAPTSELMKLHNIIQFLLAGNQQIPMASIAETLYYLHKVLENEYSAISELKRCLMRCCVGACTTLRVVTLISKFSWGKSTLLNALIGDTILSADLRAETKRVTKVLQGHGYAEIIEYVDDVRLIHHDSVDRLAERVKMLTSVRGDEHGEIIDYYVVVPTTAGWEDILLVDTPGYNSRYEDHDLIADSAWPKSDIVLAIYDPSQVGEANFTEKVRQVLDAGKNVVFIVTKCDQVAGREAVLRGELSSALNQEVCVIFLSGYHALFSRMWVNGAYALDDIQQEWDLYVNEDGMRVSGQSLRPEHAKLMLAASNIGQLEQTLWSMLGDPI